MSRQKIEAALNRYEVPRGYEHFLFILPAFYVAKSDGKISTKETITIIVNSIHFNLVDTHVDKEEKNEFHAFAHNKVLTFMGKTNLGDLDILVNAINSKLEEYPEIEANRIRKKIRELCIAVAKSSGPLFREKILREEREMLDRIFKGID